MPQYCDLRTKTLLLLVGRIYQSLTQQLNFLSAILPGSYPSERSRSVESAAVGNMLLEEHDLPPSQTVAEEVAAFGSQGIEELGQHEALYGLSEGPGKFSHPTRIRPTSDIAVSSVA